MNNFPKIDYSWTLFLDRDGVLNKKIEGDYVKSVNELEILPNVLQSLAFLSKRFHKIIIVTNQQGIGKQLMTENDLNDIHQHLINLITTTGGRIDGIYFAPQLESENALMRKPNIGMALTAQKEHPSIDFQKSIMVGDSISDMIFAEKSQMFGVFIGHSGDHFSINSLHELRKYI